MKVRRLCDYAFQPTKLLETCLTRAEGACQGDEEKLGQLSETDKDLHFERGAFERVKFTRPNGIGGI